MRKRALLPRHMYLWSESAHGFQAASHTTASVRTHILSPSFLTIEKNFYPKEAPALDLPVQSAVRRGSGWLALLGRRVIPNQFELV